MGRCPSTFYYSYVAWVDSGVCPHNRLAGQELKHGYNPGCLHFSVPEQAGKGVIMKPEVKRYTTTVGSREIPLKLVNWLHKLVALSRSN
jgi:hypothetical protein